MYKRQWLLNGRPLDEREPGEDVPLTSFGATCFVPSGRGLLITTSLFEDTYGLGYIALAEPETVARVEVRGAVHQGLGEMENLKHLRDNRYAVQYNIDGESWLYEGEFDEDTCAMRLDAVICGRGQLSGGVMDSFDYDKAADRYALSFSTATSPTQIYTIEGAGRNIVRQHTIERVLGLPDVYKRQPHPRRRSCARPRGRRWRRAGGPGQPGLDGCRAGHRCAESWPAWSGRSWRCPRR